MKDAFYFSLINSRHTKHLYLKFKLHIPLQIVLLQAFLEISDFLVETPSQRSLLSTAHDLRLAPSTNCFRLHPVRQIKDTCVLLQQIDFYTQSTAFN